MSLKRKKQAAFSGVRSYRRTIRKEDSKAEEILSAGFFVGKKDLIKKFFGREERSRSIGNFTSSLRLKSVSLKKVFYRSGTNAFFWAYRKPISFLKRFPWKGALAAVLVLIIGASSYLVVLGATYAFTQTSWSGGATANTATHAGDMSGWDQYASKDAHVAAVNSGADLEISTLSTSASQTTDTDFSAGTQSNTTVLGSGSSGSVNLTSTVTSPVWSTLASTPAAIASGGSLVYPGSGDYIYGYRGGTTDFYRYSISGNSWTTMAATPGSIGFGVSLVYPGSGDYIYGYRGGSTTFYRYSISGNSWTTIAAAPGSVSGGPLVYPGSGDYIYGYRGSNTTDFYRYSISGDSWTNMAAIPAAVNGGGSLVYPGSGDYIYGYRGKTGAGVSTATFYRYSVSGNSWTTMADTPAAISDGGSLVYPGSGDYIYGYQGNNATAFYRYSVFSNTWTTMTAVPSTIGAGGSLVYPGSGDYIYGYQGSSTTFYRYSLSLDMSGMGVSASSLPASISTGAALVYPGSGDYVYGYTGNSSMSFLRYSLSGDRWDIMASAPATVSGDASLIYPGSGDYIYGYRGGSTTDFYRYSISGNSWTSMTVTPGTINSGGSLVYPGSGDYIYGYRGNSSTTFYRYSISGNSWTSMTATPGAISSGGSLVYPGSGDYIYGYQGNDTVTFYRHSISNNSWAIMTPVPGTVSLGGSLVYPGSGDYIYGYRGNSTTDFYRYSISGNSWTSMAVTPATIGTGGSLVYPGSGDYIYGYRGGSSTTFYRYSISGNSWTSMTAAPGFIDAGGSLVYPGSGDYIYGYRGNSSTTFYRYSISGNSWTSMTSTPNTIGAGGSLVYPSSGDYIYGYRGNSTTDFYRYSISGNSWTSMAVTPATIGTGGSLVYLGSGDYIYGYRGGNATDFYRFTLSMQNPSPWMAMPNVTGGNIGFGSDLVYPGSGDYIYGLAGSTSTSFYRYSISGASWSSMAAVPGTVNLGGSLVYPSSGDYIYGYRGNSTTDFYRYSISGNSWTSMAVTPATIGTGGSLVYPGSGDYIYGYQGSGAGLYRYSISGNSWTSMTSTPNSVSAGGSLVYPGSGDYIYGYRGGGTDFYRYSISGNSWTSMTSTPNSVSTGGSLIYPGSGDYIYGYQGGSTGFYRYSISGNSWSGMRSVPSSVNSEGLVFVPGSYVYGFGTSSNSFQRFTLSSYVSSGVFTSSVIDTTTLPAYSTLSFNKSTPSGTTLSMDARSGNSATPDGTWSSWTTNIASGADISAFAGNRYIQYRANLTSDIADATSELSDITIDYSYYPTDQALISSPYDSSSDSNLIAKLSWTASGTSSLETVRFQMRSASSVESLTSASWCGYEDCSGTTYFDNAENDLSLSAGHPFLSGDDDRYFQYKAILASAGQATPTVGSVTVQYVVNAPPGFDASFNGNGIVVSQVSDANDPNWGKVRIDYRVRDTDTTSGNATPGFVTPSFAYDTGSGFVSITDLYLSSGALSNKAVDGTSYTTYTAYWDAQSQVPGISIASLQLRVTINDNEAANNTASATDTSLALDTVSPVAVGTAIVVDASVIPAALAFSASDDAAMEMEYSLNSDFSGASWEAYSTSKTIALATDPDTVYVRFRDAWGNISATFSATTPETPTSVIIQDVSNLTWSPEEYRLFLAWKTAASPVPGFSHYTVSRSSDEVNYSGLATIGSRTTNYYADNTVLFDTSYYYKISTVDTNGNVSYLSSSVNGKPNGAQDAGEGGGGSESTPPTIFNVSVSGIDTTQATLTWDTDELSSSTVGYSTSSSVFTTEVGNSIFVNNTTGVGSHSVTLTDLLPNTTYYLQAKSTDPTGNMGTNDNGGIGYSFTTLPGPAISGVALVSASNEEITVSWHTTTPATTFLAYATSVSGGGLVSPVTEVGSSNLVTSHTQTVSGLSIGTTYYFTVKSTDGSSNIATDNNGGNFYEFTTTSDTEAPVLSSIDASFVTDEGVVVTWITDEQATGQLEYATVSDGPYTTTTPSSVYGRSHYVTLSGLDADTIYYFKVISDDLSGNQVVSTESSFTTSVSPELNHPALSEITDISDPPSFLTDKKAVVSFETDQSALCYIEYGTSSENYDETSALETLYNREHSVYLTGLTFSTQYFYKIDCADNNYNSVVSDEKYFTTLEEQVASGSEAGDTVAPNISNVSVSGITGENAIVTWDTDENANSFVRYGLTNEFGDMAGDDLVNVDVAEYAAAHTVTLKNLIPGTEYYFTALSSDTSGNVTQSPERTFGTKDAASISSIRSFSQKIGEVTVTWKTSSKTTSTVEYGLTESYSDKKESNTSSTDHELTISGLTANTTYHFRVKGKNADGNMFASDDLTFEPKSPPTISNVSVEALSEREAKVKFTSNVPTDALVVYQGVGSPEANGSQGDPTLSQTHEITLRNLAPGTRYRAIIKAQDESGNASQNSEEVFETKEDNSPPEASQVRTDVALTQDNKVQALISWTTDELATSSILYREGQYGEEKELVVSRYGSKNHIGVLTTFNPGAVYYFKVKISDEFGNESVSSDYMALTPKRTENIVEIIIGNFKDIFSWTR